MGFPWRSRRKRGNSEFRIRDGPSAAGAASPQQAGATEERFRACGRGQRLSDRLWTLRGCTLLERFWRFGERTLPCPSLPREGRKRVRPCAAWSEPGFRSFRNPMHQYLEPPQLAGEVPEGRRGFLSLLSQSLQKRMLPKVQGDRKALWTPSGMHLFGEALAFRPENLPRPLPTEGGEKARGSSAAVPEPPKEDAAEGPGRSESPGRARRREIPCFAQAIYINTRTKSSPFPITKERTAFRYRIFRYCRGVTPYFLLKESLK